MILQSRKSNCFIFLFQNEIFSALLNAATVLFQREYDPTQSVFCNSYPWLFPGGVGDLYDIKRGTKCPKEWGRHLLHYYDNRFLDDQMFFLFVFNSIERHENNREGSYFFESGKFLGQNPPTIEKLKDNLAAGDDRYIQVLRYYARNIKGSDNYWCGKTQELESWIQHHVSRGRGPPTFFITFSCAENWWPDLRRCLAQLESHAGNEESAKLLRDNDFNAMKKASRKYPLFVNDFFMKRAKSFMKEVMKGALGIDHYWGRVEFVPGRGQIHIHMLGIAKDRAYLDGFYKAKTMKEKAAVVDKYAREHLDMIADINIKDDNRKYFPPHPQSPLARKFCEVTNENEDARLLCQDCMCHHCNKFCLRDNKKNKPRTCRCGFGNEEHFNCQDTPGMDLLDESAIVKDKKGIYQFRMKRTQSVRAVQHSRTLLKGWRGNCDIKLLLYFSDPNLPDIGEIEDVCKYVVAYTGKRNHTGQQEKTAIQDLITG